MIIHGDCREVLPTLAADSFDCIVTSPPYWGLRDYGVEGQIGLEETLPEYLSALMALQADLWRVLKPSGVFWINIGDAYAGSWGAQSREHAGKHAGNVSALSANQIKAHPRARAKTGSLTRTPGLKPKDLIGLPWRVAFALQDAGWWLRSEIIWAKPNGMPGSQIDRCTSAHETIFMLTKSADYWSDFDAIKTPLRESSLVRLAQDVQAQAGSHRANGDAKTNGPMKAVVAKQGGHGRRHNGFNERWDAMTFDEQRSSPAMMRDVWFVPPEPSRLFHFAMMPTEIARRCILAGCPPGGHVLDPFGGSGTTELVAARLGRRATSIELNENYVELAANRLRAETEPWPRLWR